MADLHGRLKSLERRRRVTSSSSTTSSGSARLLTGEELAERMGVTGETIRRWAGQGMPSCGTHPARPTWPMFNETACRSWAAQHQPQTALRPPVGGPVDAAGAGASSGGEPSLADLRLQGLRLRNQELKMRLEEQMAGLLWAHEAKAAWRRHAAVIRERFNAMPARTAGRLVQTLGLEDEIGPRFEFILSAEMARVLDELSDDPLADAAAIKEQLHGVNT